MTAAASATSQPLYRRLARRNRVIGVLRVIVPILGLALVCVPVVQIALSMVSAPFSVAGVRLERDTLVVDSPRFEGVTATGEAYRMTAERTETRAGDLDVADLYGLHIALIGAEGYRAEAALGRAQWTMSTEQLVSNEDVRVSDSTGAEGLLAGAAVDWPAQTVTSDGPVTFVFSGGNRLVARAMRHDISNATWSFEGVRLEMTPTPDAGLPRRQSLETVP